MRYGKIVKNDIANGPGIRVSLFVSGCYLDCPGCFNKQSQDHDFGVRFDDEEFYEIFEELSKKEISGLSILGGDPFSPRNISTVYTLVKLCKEDYPDKDIRMWSGYTIEELMARDDERTVDTLKYADVLVDGRFVLALKDLSLEYRGSSNQRVIDLKHYFKDNEQ